MKALTIHQPFASAIGHLEDIRPLPWVPYAPGFLGFWKVEPWRLGACRAVYEAAWSELAGRSVACAS